MDQKPFFIYQISMMNDFSFFLIFFDILSTFDIFMREIIRKVEVLQEASWYVIMQGNSWSTVN